MNKRLTDKAKAIALAPFLLPAFTLAALAVKLDLGSPILFKQTRYGHKGEPFDIIKFRTMREAKPNEDSQDFDAERVTRVGHFLRRYGLDETPQILNVFNGDMNIIGPRPRSTKMPISLTEIYNNKPGLLAPSTPTDLRRVTPNMPDYNEKISKANAHDIQWLENRTTLKSIQLILNCAIASITTDRSGAKPKYESGAYEPPEPPL